MVINTMINGDWWCLVLCCLYCSIVFDQLPGWTSIISICFDVSKGWQGLDPYPYAAPFLNVPRLSTIPGRICDKKCRPRYCATVLGLSSFCCDRQILQTWIFTPFPSCRTRFRSVRVSLKFDFKSGSLQIPSGNLTVSYWKWPNRNSWFSH